MKPILSVTLLLFIAISVNALPRYSANYEQSCFLCHVSPSGGGIRNGYGTNFFAAKELSFKSWADEDLAKYKPKIAPGVTVGADIRTLLFAADRDSVVYSQWQNKSNTFLQMEGSFSIAFQPIDEITLMIQHDLSGVSEVWAMRRSAFMHSYFKIGMFRPDYGWGGDDHTSFTRFPFSIREPYNETGVEVGINPERLDVTAGVFNGNGGGASIPDYNSQKALLLSVIYRPAVFDPVKVGVGFSAWYQANEGFESNQWDSTNSYRLTDTGKVAIIGPHISLAYGRLTLLGEADWKENHGDQNGYKREGLFSSNMLYITLHQGVAGMLGYEYMNVDRSIKSNEIQRFTAGVQTFPTPFTELSPMIRVTNQIQQDGKRGLATTALMMFHFFF